jgi:hypothetical protein
MDKIIVPEYYKFLASELKPLVKEIQSAFVNRPVPTGRYIDDISLFATLWLNPLELTIKKLASDFNMLGSLVAPHKEPALYEIRHSVRSLSAAIKSVIEIFHDIWKRPFSPNIADGQVLISAVPEMILKECLGVFEKVIDIVENPHEVKAKYGSFDVNMQITFGDDEIKQFEKWLNKRRPVISGISEKRYSFGNLALAFVLGWWIGDD